MPKGPKSAAAPPPSTGDLTRPRPPSAAGGRYIDGPVCKWKCDEDFDSDRWEDKFDCSIDQFHKLNSWVRSVVDLRWAVSCHWPSGCWGQ